MEYRKLEALNGFSLTPETLVRVIEIIHDSLREIFNECMFLRGRLEEFEVRLQKLESHQLEMHSVVDDHGDKISDLEDDVKGLEYIHK